MTRSVIAQTVSTKTWDFEKDGFEDPTGGRSTEYGALAIRGICDLE